MDASTIILGAIFVLYIPVQLAALIGGIILIAKAHKVWWKIILGILLLMIAALMLPFTRIVAGLLYIMATGGSFGA